VRLEPEAVGQAACIVHRDVKPNNVLVSHDMALAIYTACAFLGGTYLLGMWKTPEDGEVTSIGIPRMLFAFVFVVMGLFLSTGLAGKDLGVLEALLPFETRSTSSAATGAVKAEPKVYKNFEEGMAAARESGKPVFLEFTGFS